MKQLLIDGDIVAFRCAASAENDSAAIAISRMVEAIDRIFADLQSTDYKIFLTGKGNFRKEIDPQYKANRTRPLPQYLGACRDFLVDQYGAIVVHGHEADDALGYSQTENSVIVSNDKDLLQIPGQNYNFVKGELIEISPERGLREFYTQLLVGDKGDNIVGVAGLGVKKAPLKLEGCETEEEMFDTVRELYADDERFHKNGQLLWIWKKEGDIWNPIKPLQSGSTALEEEVMQECTPQMAEVTIPSTEPIGMSGTTNG